MAMNKANQEVVDRQSRAQDTESVDGVSELLPSKSYLHLELLPYLGLMQAPQRSIGSSAAATGLFNKPKKLTNGTDAITTSPHTQAMKLSKALLDVAFMPPAKIDALPTALGEKEDLDAAEGSDDEMKRKPSAPAVKMEFSEDDDAAEEPEDEQEVEKLYLSDDDIEDF
jgi:hypothetical protein